VVLAATVSPQLAVEVGGVYLVLQIIEGNVLVPLVMRNTVRISPFLVILSILVGAAAGGFVGALLAVPIAAMGEVVIEGLQAREVPVAQNPVAGDREDDEADQSERDQDERQARGLHTPDGPEGRRHPA
jgi:predicted PurR-regulated permease PerM